LVKLACLSLSPRARLQLDKRLLQNKDDERNGGILRSSQSTLPLPPLWLFEPVALPLPDPVTLPEPLAAPEPVPLAEPLPDLVEPLFVLVPLELVPVSPVLLEPVVLCPVDELPP
jgi:hypothetical protein